MSITLTLAAEFADATSIEEANVQLDAFREEVIPSVNFGITLYQPHLALGNADTFIVVCLDEGEYVIATRRVFNSRVEAQTYAGTVADTRNPLVIAGRFHQLRIQS